jgi:uncharacterized protein (DUF3084 family)
MGSILVLIIVSGLIAWAGDVIGRRIGRRRLSIFGIRPKNTAIVITIFTGMVITLLTLVILAMISKEARFALMDSDRIMKELGDIQQEFDRSKDVIRTLNEERLALESTRSGLVSEISRMTREVEIVRNDLFAARRNLEALSKGKIIFNKDEVLGYVTVKGKSQPDQLVMELEKLTRNIYDMAQTLGFKVKSFKKTWGQMEAPIRTFAEQLDENANMAIVIQTTERVAKGQELQLNLKAIPNRLVFQKGDVLEGEIDASQNRQDIRMEILGMLEEINIKARSRDMVVNPMEEVDSMILYDLVNQVKKYNKPVRLEIYVDEDTSITGPMVYSMGIHPIEK